MYARCYFAGLSICVSHRKREHFNSNKNKWIVISLCRCVFFESFKRDLIGAKAAYISQYYLICRFVIMTLRLRLKFLVASLTINSHRGRGEILRFHNDRALRKGTRGETYQELSSSLWLQLSGPACVVPRVDMCEETRDDGRRPLTAISAPSANHTSSTVRGNFVSCLFSFIFFGSVFYHLNNESL